MLLKHYRIITVIVAILMVPAVALSANKFGPTAAVAGSDNTVIVPLEIANEDGVMAIDIPLSFSEGVTLKEVTFEQTRVEHFDLKISRIDNDERTVVIGLIHQLSPTPKEPLAAGEGVIANLVFEVNDPCGGVVWRGRKSADRVFSGAELCQPVQPEYRNRL